MRKKWTYVAIVSMMLGVAPVFTGCVDTDEPAGIEQLRGAKAELLKAKAAVEQANAEYRLAEIEWLNAKTAQEAAIAKWKEYEAEYQRLENEALAAKNEFEKAKYEAEAQYYRNLMEEQMITHETAMINLEKAKAVAQRAYEVALKQIAIAEAIGSEDTYVTLQGLKAKLDEAYETLYGEEGDGRHGLEVELRNAQQKLYDAQMNKLAGYDSSEEVADGEDPSIWIPTLENKVAEAEADVVAAQEVVDKLEEFKAAPVEDTDWRAQVDKIEEEIDALEAERDEISLQITEAKTSPEYLEKYQAVHGVEVDGNLVEGSFGTKHVLNNANVALAKKQSETKLSVDAYKPETEITSEMLAAINAKRPAEEKLTADNFSYEAFTYQWAADGAQNPNMVDKYPKAIKNIIDNKYEAWLDILDEATPKSANEIAQAEAALANAKAAEEKAKADYEKNRDEDWKAILDIVQNAKSVTVPTGATTDFGKLVKAYNDAYGNLDKAITDWNKAIKEAYDEAYNAELEEQKEQVRIDVLTVMNGGTISGDTYGTKVVAGFNASQALDDWKDFIRLELATEANFKKAVDDNIGDANTSKEDREKISKEVWAQIDNFVYLTENNENWEGKRLAAEAGEKAAETFDTEGLGTKITTEIGNVKTAYDALDKAKTTFETYAKNNYAQKLTEAAAKLLTKEMLAGVVKDGKATVDANWANYDEETTGYRVWTIANTKIEDKEVADATDTEFDSESGNAAVLAASKRVFGLDDKGNAWYVEPTPEEWEASSYKDEKSFAGLYYKAVEDREGYEAIISANEDLQKLEAEIETALADFKKQIAADYAEAFKDEQAAYDEALTKHNEALKALAEAEAQFSNLYVEQNKIQAQINAKTTLSSTLKKLIWDNLGIEWPLGSAGNETAATPTEDSYDPKKFADQLDEAIEIAKQDLADAEQALKKAEVELQKAQDGKYDSVAMAEYELSVVQARYEKALEAYNKAQADLEKYLEIMAAAEEEQPAE